MYDFEARHMIEALRSGVPSRAVGQYFSEARPKIMKEISDHLDQVCEQGKSSGMVICGKYGEGKTHLLNTVFNLAHSNNMVVSYLSLSKETPMDKLYLVYQKLIQSTYLPQREQPGFLVNWTRYRPRVRQQMRCFYMRPNSSRQINCTICFDLISIRRMRMKSSFCRRI